MIVATKATVTTETVEAGPSMSHALTPQELAALKEELAVSRKGQMRPARGPKATRMYYIR